MMKNPKDFLPGLDKAIELVNSINHGDFGNKTEVKEFKKIALRMLHGYKDNCSLMVEVRSKCSHVFHDTKHCIKCGWTP